MSRPNYIKFVEHLYRFNPKFTDGQIMSMVCAVYYVHIGLDTLSVWKAKLRKKGLKIPDRRKNKHEKM